MKKFAIGLALSALSLSALANTQTYKTLPNEKATFELCQSMATAFNTETMDFQPVADIASPYWRYGEIDPNRSLTNITHNSSQLARFGIPFWGKPLNTLFVDTDKDKLGYFVRHNFMMRRQNLALDFYCDFYKNNDGWSAVGIHWNDTYRNFFE
ncbi:hypothetical protein [Moraxella ovis]|uniref:hypothetical protein n=1 Tax=Moraxella ovis TaxID=29433 RepID=UPI000D843162|nr:hypothetical protein [Moraxella ovis]SPX85016.1 Uncharacterised protein [Moraxella ovis]STZ05285.1 Uncharacterised protein [Moraxella ovis]